MVIEMKKTTSIFMAIIIILCLATSVYSTDLIQPLWDHTLAVDASINFIGTKGTFTVCINGNSDVTDVYLMAWLYYKDSNGDWVEQTTWGAIASTPTLATDRTFTGISGVEYKVDYTAYVYVGLSCDEISFSTSATCP